MSILEIIESEPTERVKIVTRGDNKYVLRGFPDSNLIEDTFYIDETTKNNKANHYTNYWKRPFNPEGVFKVLLVAKLLEHELDSSKRYDEVEIAGVYLKDAALFMDLWNAACQIIGFGENQTNSLVEEIAAKNSEALID